MTFFGGGAQQIYITSSRCLGSGGDFIGYLRGGWFLAGQAGEM